MKLVAEKRDVLGKKTAALRAAGMLPAVVYGHGVTTTSIAVPVKEFTKLFREGGYTTVFDLELDGKAHRVMAHEVAKSVRTGELEHVDFYAVSKTEKITADVPLVFEGVAPAVKNDGGVIAKSILELEVEALPDSMPHEIVIDLSVLDAIDAAIHVKDIKLPKGVTTDVDPEAVVVTVIAQREEEEAAPADLADVKVEGEEKKAARDASKE